MSDNIRFIKKSRRVKKDADRGKRGPLSELIKKWDIKKDIFELVKYKLDEHLAIPLKTYHRSRKK